MVGALDGLRPAEASLQSQEGAQVFLHCDSTDDADSLERRSVTTQPCNALVVSPPSRDARSLLSCLALVVEVEIELICRSRFH